MPPDYRRMFRRLFFVVCLAALTPIAAIADDSVRCVQNQLSALGHNPGAPDGLLGRRTVAAFEAYAHDIAYAADAPLMPASATAWCRRIGLEHPALQRFWPSRNGRARVIFGDDVHPRVRAVVEQQISSLHQTIARRMQVDIAGTDLLIVGSSVRDLTDLVTQNLPYRTTFPALAAALDGQCSGDPIQPGAFTVQGIAVICVPSNTTFGSGFSPGFFRDMMAHEVSHLIVRQLLGTLPNWTSDADRVPLGGPIWLHEGLATVFGEALSLGRSPSTIYSTQERRMTERSYPPLADLEERAALETLRTEVYLVGAMAAAILVEDHGFAGFGTLFEEMATGARFETAFQSAFGQPVAAFYAAFDTRVNPAAAAFSVPDNDPSLPALTVNAEPAANAAHCVQAQLNAAGFDAGPVDGQFGPRTRAALTAFRQAHQMTTGLALNARNAPAWCARIGTQIPQLRLFWPSGETAIAVTNGDGVDRSVGAWVEHRFPQIHRRAAARLGVGVSATDAVLVGTSAQELRQLLADHPGVAPNAELEAWLTDTCEPSRYVQSFALPGVALICLTPNTRPRRPETIRDLEFAFARSAVQLIRWQVSGVATDDLSRVAAEGPAWLSEGYAALFAHRVARDSYAPRVFREPIFRRFAGRSLPDLRQFETRDALLTPAAGDLREAGALAASFLIDAHRDGAYGLYLTTIGTGVPSDAAFEVAFGQSLAAFYRLFDRTKHP